VARRVLDQPMALAVIGPFEEDAFGADGAGEAGQEAGLAAAHGGSGGEGGVR
jgi:hypothetical protein